MSTEPRSTIARFLRDSEGNLNWYVNMVTTFFGGFTSAYASSAYGVPEMGFAEVVGPTLTMLILAGICGLVVGLGTKFANQLYNTYNA